MGDHDGEPAESPSYRGFVGAYRYAFRRSGSVWFRLYVAASAVLVAFVTVLVALAMIRWIARPAGLFGDRGLLAVVGILLVLPVAAPVLLVARRHRRTDRPQPASADRLVGLAGFALVFGIYLGLVIVAPAEGTRGSLAAALDALPTVAGVVPPLAGVGLLVLAARRTRPGAP